MNIPRFSLGHKPIIAIMVLIVTVWGLVSFFTISRREDPDIRISIALVVTIWPGAGAEKVERLVTRKLEDSIESIGTLEKLESTSRENLSIILVEMDYATDLGLAWQILRNRIEEVRPDLPSGIIGPDVLDDFGDVTAMIWSLSSSTAEPAELRRWADEFKAELHKVESVGKVELVGEQQEAIYIEGPLDSFTMYDFSPLAAAQIIDAHNVNMPSGYLRTDYADLRLDTSGSFAVLQDIRRAVLDVSRETGHPLQVQDVFTVRQAYREPPSDLMFTNGILSVGLDVRMRHGHNIVFMGEEVRRIAAEFEDRLPSNVKLNLVHDQPRQVDDFIASFLRNLQEGLLIVVLVMFLAMGPRATVIVAVSLPLSIVATFALMPAFGVDMETVSIASFIVALGMLVDNAIIVTDNIYRRMEEGEERREAAWRGAQDLAIPVVSGTMATAMAFLPLLLMRDEPGAYVRSLPIVVTVSLAASLVLAMTVTPVLASWLLRLPKRRRRSTVEATAPRRPRWTTRAYSAGMRFGMKLRYVVLLLTVASFLGALLLMRVVGFSYFPESERDQFTVDIWLPSGTGLAETARVARGVEEIVAREPEVVSYVTYVGKGGPRFFLTVMPEFNAANYAQVMVNTKDAGRTRDLVTRLDRVLGASFPGARVTAAPLIMGIPVEAPIAFRVTGPDLREMRSISHKLQEVLRDIEGTRAVRDNMGEEIISLGIEVDSEAAAMFGVTATEIAVSLVTAFEGLPVTKVREGSQEDEIPVFLRLVEHERDVEQALHLLSVPSQATGAKVPLAAFAEVSPQYAPSLIKRHNNRRSVTVLANVQGRLADDIMREAWPRIGEIELPPGYEIEISGEQAERNEAFAELAVIFALIIGLLLLMLTIQFNSVKRALAILITVPLATIGAILGLFLSGNSFSFMAFLGVISLAGIVIKNAVVWVEFVDRALNRGREFQSAIIEAGLYRLRPIMLTALTTIGGLLPLALFGGVLWEGMAWAMVVGLALSTILTLVVNPILFYALFRRRYDR